MLPIVVTGIRPHMPAVHHRTEFTPNLKSSPPREIPDAEAMTRRLHHRCVEVMISQISAVS